MTMQTVPRAQYGPEPRPLWDRFWEKVDASGDCWEWTSTKRMGYGRFYVDRVRGIRQAHRFVWELLVGPIPDGHHVDHLCRNPGCVNPDHLDPVPPAVNFHRGFRFTPGPPATCKCGVILELVDTNRYLGVERCAECDLLTRRAVRAWRRAGQPGDQPQHWDDWWTDDG